MPGKKDSKVPADQESAGIAAAPETTPQSIDLMDGLAVGTPDLKPTPVTFRGTDFEITRFYTPEQVWELSDLQRQVLRTSEEWKANLEAQLKALLSEDTHAVIDDLVAMFGDRSQTEVNRFMRKMYQVAGLANSQGEYLAF